MVYIPQVITSLLCASLLPGIGETAEEETSIIVPAPSQKAGRLSRGQDGAVGRRGRDRDGKRLCGQAGGALQAGSHWVPAGLLPGPHTQSACQGRREHSYLRHLSPLITKRAHQATRMSGFLRFNRTNVRMRSKPGSPDALTYSTKLVVLDKLMTWRALSLTLQCVSNGSPSLR